MDTRRGSRRRLLGGALTVAGLGALGGVTYRALTGGPTMEEAVDALIADAAPPGVGLTLIATSNGKTLYAKGFGESDPVGGVAATVETVYDIGSVTKQFTAAAIVRLWTLGELDPGDRLGRFFTGMGDKAEITVHQLLTHTSGLIDTLGPDDDPLSRSGLIDAMAASVPLAAPGVRYVYSNVGYSVLAAIVEELTSGSYERFLADAFFAPLGMSRTGYLLPDWDRRDVAVEHGPDGLPLGRPNERTWGANGPYWNLLGNGGVLSTATDMAAWSRALDGDAVLSAPARNRLFEPWVAEDASESSHYGYGWVMLDVGDVEVAWHNGGNGASYAEFARVSGGPSVFWATNEVARSGRWNLEESDLAMRVLGLLLDP
ncbi:serine hydrolase domain-containing protein [Stackebrandtia soli]|uniref:serine hydrolase domain-containing protein n=1 Tax=Stackebrandtia soli TaxID=1892856 RepID=UPI0039EB6A9D